MAPKPVSPYEIQFTSKITVHNLNKNQSKMTNSTRIEQLVFNLMNYILKIINID
ncbi:hypothetical protein Amet_3093 [Alkaliphilus metalliredigens QYMF]|uniref:Uncharacterized protein n=1 Tax=Alkaliphilus metalliredigens (strain QYMF) TaxID=293826 RepID=A6TSR5_ALKMQ|nr:hypothetical protein Amet_3093 [Alkaliphilus metalliredigens QYMF]